MATTFLYKNVLNPKRGEKEAPNRERQTDKKLKRQKDLTGQCHHPAVEGKNRGSEATGQINQKKTGSRGKGKIISSMVWGLSSTLLQKTGNGPGS